MTKKPMRPWTWVGALIVAAAALFVVLGSPRGTPVEVRPGAPDTIPGSTASPSNTPHLARGEAAAIRGSVTAPLKVNLLGLAPGDEVTVVWVSPAEVAVFAGGPSRFTTLDTLVQATVSGGPVRLELPSAVRPLTLVVNGRLWLRNVESGLELLLESRGRYPDTQRFVVPAREAPEDPRGT